MYQVTILWLDAEIGYGEAYSEMAAREEAVESVPSIYFDGQTCTEWEFSVVRTAEVSL